MALHLRASLDVDGFPAPRPEPAGDAYRAARRPAGAGLTLAQRALLELLTNLSASNGTCWPGERWLAEQLHLCDRQVRRLLDQLHALGCLAISTRRGKTNRYTVLRDRPEAPPSPLRLAPGSGLNAGAPARKRKRPRPGTPQGRAGMGVSPAGGKAVDNPAQTPDITSTPPGHHVRTRPRTSCPPTKDINTFTGPANSLFDPASGWFGVAELPSDGQAPQKQLEALFRQGACRACVYGGRDPRYLTCRRAIRTVIGLVAGRSVVFLKLAVDGHPGRREELTVHAKTLAAWRFK